MLLTRYSYRLGLSELTGFILCIRYDLIETVPSLTVRAVAGTVVCMAVICALFVPNICCVIIATLSIVSINISWVESNWIELD
jgi:hypothetical protein